MAILMMLILPIHDHGTCFHLFLSTLISLFTVVKFSEYRSFTFLVTFIPRYFIFLVDISNGIFFLISVSDILLLVYKNAFHFWVLTLYPAVLPNSFIRSSSFLVESIGFSMYTIMSPANNDSFGWLLFLFLVWLLWLGLPILCWIGVVRVGILALFLMLVGKL